MPLTDIALKKLHPSDRPYKRSDQNGLYILVKPNGSKHWHLKYRFNGKEKLMSYGPYPLISLKDARDKRDRDRKLLLEGIDPATVKKERKRAAEVAARGRFEVLAAELLEKNQLEGRAEQTLKKKSWLLDMAIHDLGTGLDVNPHLFRHIAAKFYLEAYQGDYESVRRQLGHKKYDTTLKFYASFDNRKAQERYNTAVLEAKRPKKRTP